MVVMMKKSFPFPAGTIWGLVLTPVAVALVTLLGISLSRPVGSLSHIFLYLLVIMVAAVWWNVKMAFYAAILSVLAIIYFFVPPRGTFIPNIEDYSYTSEFLGLVFFLVLSFFIVYLISALRRERDRAKKLAILEREAKIAVVKASEKLERQRQRTLYLQHSRQLLADTIEPLQIIPVVLNELVDAIGGYIVLTLEGDSAGPDRSTAPAFENTKIVAGNEPTLIKVKGNLVKPSPDRNIPLRSGGQLLGHLTYFYDTAGRDLLLEDGETTASTLTALAGYIAVSLENSKLYQALEFQNNEIAQLLRGSLRADTALNKRVEQLSIFYRLSAAVISGIDRNTLMGLGLSEIGRIMNFSVGAVMLLDARDQTLELVAKRGDLALKEGSRLPLTDAIATEVVRERRPYVYKGPDAKNKPILATQPTILANKSHSVESYIYLPIASESETFGLLAVGSDSPNRYKVEDRDFLAGLTRLLTMAIVSHRYYEERERAASEEERNRIARELHDGLAQSINYIGLKTQLIRELYQAGESKQVQEEIERIMRVAELARMDVREALYGLRHTTHDRTIQEALVDLAHNAAELSGIPVALETANVQNWPDLSLAEQIQLLRITQEALSNIQKHSQASQARLSVDFQAEPGVFKMLISDNGQGFQPEKVTSKGSNQLGLGIMRERAAKIGAKIQISSSPGLGTTIEVVYKPNSANTVKENLAPASSQG
jgi:nitrate/nitrite-specific signal transduction histidine kinase